MWWRRTAAPDADGAAARAEAEQAREQARDRWVDVLGLAEDMRELRDRNHFAEQIEQSMRERRK